MTNPLAAPDLPWELIGIWLAVFSVWSNPNHNIKHPSGLKGQSKTFHKPYTQIVLQLLLLVQ